MDIEGFEIPALRGAIKTIKKYHPVLLISVYHRPEAVFEAIKILKNCGDYKFMIKKLVSYHPTYETSLIAYTEVEDG